LVLPSASLRGERGATEFEMKVSSFLFFAVAIWFTSLAPVNAGDPDQFINELKRHSPEYDGVSLRRYQTKDLDQDGVLEVLETINQIEEDTTGLLNVELAPAFEWVNVYCKKGSDYGLALGEFPDFLRQRKAAYLSWLERFEKPASLNSDSQELLKANGPLFKKTLHEQVDRINRILGSERPNAAAEK